MTTNLLPLRVLEGASPRRSRFCPGPSRPLRRCFARAPWCARPTASASARPSAPEPAGGGPFRGPSSGPRVSAVVPKRGSGPSATAVTPASRAGRSGPGLGLSSRLCPVVIRGRLLHPFYLGILFWNKNRILLTKQTNSNNKKPHLFGVRKREEVCKLGPGLSPPPPPALLPRAHVPHSVTLSLSHFLCVRVLCVRV